MKKLTKVLLILATSILLLGCKQEKMSVFDACMYLKKYLVVAVPADTPATKRASLVQIEQYKRYCPK